MSENYSVQTWRWRKVYAGMLFLVSATVVVTLTTVVFGDAYSYIDLVTNISIKYAFPNQTDVPRAMQPNKTYLINWYQVPAYVDYQFLSNVTFETCDYSNCVFTYERKKANISDAILFDGRSVPKQVDFKRQRGQVWIFGEDETPLAYDVDAKHWRTEKHWISGFNWTMTYNKDNTDIFLPYGELRKHPKPVIRDFIKIAKEKRKDFIGVVSHCPTYAKREQYIKKMKEESKLNVEIYGSCGNNYWKCGNHYEQKDECYGPLVAPYKFFLSFENAYCHQYFTEKFFTKFNYDIILISMGGSPGEATKLFPNGTFISTDSFKTVKDLGVYLKKLLSSTEVYADMLKQKSQYYDVGFRYCYQRSMCDICKRMNNLEQYRKQIPDIYKWAYNNTPCRTIHNVP